VNGAVDEERVRELEKQLDEARKTLAQEKTALESQLAMWQEKTKLKQNNYVQLQETHERALSEHEARVKEITQAKVMLIPM
jgi:hypothetical protein